MTRDAVSRQDELAEVSPRYAPAFTERQVGQLRLVASRPELLGALDEVEYWANAARFAADVLGRPVAYLTTKQRAWREQIVERLPAKYREAARPENRLPI